MKALVESSTPIYMTGVVIGMGCGFLAILIFLGVLTAEAGEGRQASEADQLGRALGDHDRRRVRVAARDRRHHRGVDDAQPLDAADAQLGIDHRVLAVVAHPAGADGVVEQLDAPAQVGLDVARRCRPRRPGLSSRPTTSAQRPARRDLARQPACRRRATRRRRARRGCW